MKGRLTDNETIVTVKKLRAEGLNRTAIAAQLKIARTTVRRILEGTLTLQTQTVHRQTPTGEAALRMKARRCKGCGKLVVMPCLYCQLTNE